MIRSAAGKIAWMARATTVVVGLAIMLALVAGVASAAFGANGGNFILGVLNKATDKTQLNGNVSGGPALQVNNNSSTGGSRALQLGVAQNRPPLVVNANAGKAVNLNADKLDGQEGSAFLGANQKAADSELLDGKDSTQFAPHVLFARVFSNGSLDTGNSSHAESSFRSGPGVYVVNFDRNIGSEACVAIAEPQVQALTATFEGPAGGRASDEVIVHLYDSFVNDSNRFVDGGFLVAVFCRWPTTA